MTPVPACPTCGASVPVRAGRGRPATYCSARCRVAAHRAHRAIPAELRERDRWVRHVHKRPVTIAGRSASSTDPTTWTTYEAARASIVGDGLGFVLDMIASELQAIRTGYPMTDEFSAFLQARAAVKSAHPKPDAE